MSQHHKMQPGFVTTNEEYYPDSRHGRVIILKNVKSINGSRKGLMRDAEKLHQLFSDMNYTVDEVEDLRAQDITRFVQKETRNPFLQDKGVFVLCILSEGDSTSIQGIRGNGVPLLDIVGPFMTDYCPSLRGKPKIFFVFTYHFDGCNSCYRQCTRFSFEDVYLFQAHNKDTKKDSASALVCEFVEQVHSQRHSDLETIMARYRENHLINITSTLRKKCIFSLDEVLADGIPIQLKTLSDTDSLPSNIKNNPKKYFPVTAKGKILIINNITFKSTTRYGAEADSRNLQVLFKQLGFSVSEYRNLTAEEMEYFIEAESRDWNISNYGIFCLCVLSYGKNGNILGTDELPITVETVLSYFTTDRCSGIRGKPKLFLVQACNPGRRDSMKNPFSDVIWERGLRNYSDTLLVVSSIEETNGGSPFVRSLVMSMQSHAHEKDICSILFDVNENLGRNLIILHTFERILFLVPVKDQVDSRIDQMKGVIYGNCAGDAIGLLTEFMSKEQAHAMYREYQHLEYSQKINDYHRDSWSVGDWTDDSDQMILIMEMIIENNKEVSATQFATRLRDWVECGFSALGDYGGVGIGRTTYSVVEGKTFTKKPHENARTVWEKSGRLVAPNGAVMRTSVLGILSYDNLERVHQNTLEICRTTHADPRCQASCIAVTTAIALMLQQEKPYYNKEQYDANAITQRSMEEALKCLPEKRHSDYQELKHHMFCSRLADLYLDDQKKIGYTYKALGAGFWALKQEDFRSALESITMEGGDADTNGAVAGALLGCKLGWSKIPESWRNGFRYQEWLDEKVKCFIQVVTKDTASQKKKEETMEVD